MSAIHFLDHQPLRPGASPVLDLSFAARLAHDWRVPISFEAFIELAPGDDCDRAIYRLQTSLTRYFPSAAYALSVVLNRADVLSRRHVAFTWRPRTGNERFLRIWTEIAGTVRGGRVTVGRVVNPLGAREAA